MRLLLWYCEKFAWHPSLKTLDHVPDAAPMSHEKSVVAFIQVEPEAAKALIDSVEKRLETAGYTAVQTPYGYFNDLSMDAPGHPLARNYRAFCEKTGQTGLGQG